MVQLSGRKLLKTHCFSTDGKETYFWYARVGLLSLLLRGAVFAPRVPPTRALAMLHTKSVSETVKFGGYPHEQCGK